MPTADELTPNAPSSLRYQWPIIDHAIEKAVIRQLHESISIYDRSGVFLQFEEEFSAAEQCGKSTLFSSGTAALHAMYVAADLGPGDEVICPAYTFFATVTPLLFTGAKPVLVDCDETGNIDMEAVEAAVNNRTKAVVVTHMWGMPGPLDALTELCQKRSLLLLQDCSHAHGARYRGRPLGAFGDMCAWSIQGAKLVTGGEGGILSTRHQDHLHRAVAFGHYNKRCKQQIPTDSPLGDLAITGLGLKLRAHPLAVVIALEVLRQLPALRCQRSTFARQFSAAFANVPGITLPKTTEDTEPAWYAYVMSYKPPPGTCSMPDLLHQLHQRGFVEFDHPGSTKPLHLLPLFQTPGRFFRIYRGAGSFGYRRGDFPVAESYFRSALKLPVWPLARDAETIRRYCQILPEVLRSTPPAQ